MLTLLRSRSVAAAAAAAVLATGLAGCGIASGGEGETVRVYSGRHYDLEQAFRAFAEQTGINVEFLYGGDAELLERIKAEGEDTPADIFMTVDAGNLWAAAEEDILAPLDSTVLDEAVPDGLKDPDDRWFGLSMRVRTLMYDPERVDPGEFATEETYAGLMDEKWAGRLCMRTANSSYVQSMVASLIDKHGRDRATEIVRGWVENDVDIHSNDVSILETIAAGGCDVGITNHYYLGRQLADDADFPVRPFWANQDGAGAHVNISGAGVLKNADNAGAAQELIEWLASDGQNSFVDGNHEFPVNPDVDPEPLIAEFGDFDYAPIDAESYGRLNAEAVEVMAEAGYR